MSPSQFTLHTARRWALTARVLLEGARDRVDALNVFPVPDGDTGTNMYLTLDGALEYVRGQFELGAGTETLKDGLALISRGMLLSARGNSGIILTQLARGLSDAVGPEVDVAGPEDLVVAFETAARTAWDSLAAPVEGTILSVARGAADGARVALDSAGSGHDLDVADVVAAALQAAEDALARTTDQLPQLRAAGVVDAGGAGLVLVIEALLSVLEERQPGAGQQVPDWWGASVGAATPAAQAAGAVGGEPGPDEADGCPHGDDNDEAVEVMYLLTGSDDHRAERLRAHLAQLGTAVAVAGGDGEYRVHVHLEDPRAAVEAGSLAGVVSEVRLTSLVDGSETVVGSAQAPTTPQGEQPGVAVVCCALGAGIADLFRASGAQVVVSGPRRRASAGQILSAVRATGAGHVIVLPNDPDTVMVSRAVVPEAARAGITVDVVPTRSLVQGLAAMAVHDPERPGHETVAAMTGAVDGVRSAALSVAEREVSTAVGPCRPGQWVGLHDGDIVAVDDRADAVLDPLLTRVLDGGAELVTVLLGADAGPEVTRVVEEGLARALAEQGEPECEVVTIRGDQPAYPVLLGVE